MLTENNSYRVTRKDLASIEFLTHFSMFLIRYEVISAATDESKTAGRASKI